MRVRATGRRAKGIGDVGPGRDQAELLPDPAGDPIDRDTVQTRESGGIYGADEREPRT